MTKPLGNNVVSPRVATILNEALGKTGESWAEFIRRFWREHNNVGAKNHIYKILNGSTIVGELGLLPLICKSLNLDFATVVQAVRDDKMENKGWAKPKFSKAVNEIAARTSLLSKSDQDEILAIIIAKNTKTKKGGK
jgi:hypothetical protein